MDLFSVKTAESILGLLRYDNVRVKELSTSFEKVEVIKCRVILYRRIALGQALFVFDSWFFEFQRLTSFLLCVSPRPSAFSALKFGCGLQILWLVGNAHVR
jgi:hypothetical protein